MAGIWNPLAPGALGLEWMATREILQPVAPGQSSWAQVLRSTTAETIDALKLRVHRDPAVTAPLFTVVDIIPVDDLIPDARTSVLYSPNADNVADSSIGAGTGWERVGGATTNLYLSIDDTPAVPPADSDYIGINNGSAPEQYICSVASGAFSTSARVCRLSIVAVHATTPSPNYGNIQFQYRLWDNVSNVSYTPPFASFMVGYYGYMVVVDCGEINPKTMLPWTPADVRSFDSVSGSGAWGLRVEAVGNANTNPIVHSMALRVDYVPTENRVAVATWNRTPTGGGDYADTDALITLPGGAASWAKPSSGDFAFLWRPAHAPMLTLTNPRADDLQWATMDADLSPVEPSTYPPVPGMVGSVVSVDSYGLALTAAAARAATVTAGVVTRAGNLALRVAGPSWSNDSQPYELGLPQLLAVDSSLTNGAGQRLRQSSGSTQNYLGLRFPVVPPTTGTSTLTVSVHRVSDGVQMGGTLVLNAADVRDLPTLGGTQARLIEANLSSAAALVSATQYEIRWVASTADDWFLLAPETHASVTAASFLGSTDTARSGASTLSDRDIEGVLLIQPTAPTGFGAVVDTETFLMGGGCKPVQWDHVDLTWTPTTLTTAFLRYEIEREDSKNPGVWEVVARLGTEATSSWSDYEARRNIESNYRMRAVATSMAFSDWVTAGPVEPQGYGANLIFTSNARPDLTVAVNYEPRVRFGFPDLENDSVMVLHGGDGALAFGESEDRGVTTSYRAVVYAAGGPLDTPVDANGDPLGHEALFQPLRDITRSPFRDPDGGGFTPHVCVLDSHGNRKFAYVALEDGENQEPGRRYHADLTAVMLTKTPTPAT